ncbi:unnamed protein product, partial [Owenia fusiformis]
SNQNAMSGGISKQILWYNDFFGEQHPCFKTPSLCLQLCPEYKCTLTSNKTLYNESDAVIFHRIGLGNTPPIKHPHQAWIFFLMESPSNYPHIPSNYNDKFNWTATFMRVSDVHVPYSVTRKLPEINQTALKNQDFYAGKEKKIIWAVSNCRTIGGREKVVEALKKLGWQVDIYGACGSKKCPRGSECEKTIGKTYMFYLAFENTLCEDYITEKPGNAIIRWEIIPITYGYGNYTAHLPPNSFINVNSFQTVSDLSKHLNKVAESRDLYNSYFEWRKTHSYLPSNSYWACDICKKLHNNHYNYYKDMEKWWSKDRCISMPISL